MADNHTCQSNGYFLIYRCPVSSLPVPERSDSSAGDKQSLHQGWNPQSAKVLYKYLRIYLKFSLRCPVTRMAPSYYQEMQIADRVSSAYSDLSLSSQERNTKHL